MHHAFKLGEAEHNLELSRHGGGVYRLHLGDQRLAVSLSEPCEGRARISVEGQVSDVVIATRGDQVFVHLDGEAYELRYEHPLERLAHAAQGGAEDGIRAPMPGSIVMAQVRAGEAVAKGQTLLVMESMKMETTLLAPRDGVVQAVNFEKGQSFERDALLLTLEPRA